MFKKALIALCELFPPETEGEEQNQKSYRLITFMF